MKHYDVIVIGGGPAGLTASIYALRSGCSVLLIEGEVLGGQMSKTHKIENYPGVTNLSGLELGMQMHTQAENLGLVTEYDFVTNVDLKNKVVSTNLSQFSATCIILSMGAKPKKLGLESEEKFLSQGVHYCATCDGNFYKGKDVVVVGGGNTAVENAIYLSNICNSVTMVVRSELKCQDIFLSTIQKLEKSGKLAILYKEKIAEIVGEEKVEGIKFDSGKSLKTDAVFVAIGNEPNIGLVEGQLKLKNGYIMADENMHTSIDGVFVAGDLRDKNLRQVTTATADGSIAGTEAGIYVNKRR